MTYASSWQNSVSLCPASFCTPRPNLPVTPGIFDFLLLCCSPLWWKGHLFFFLVLALEDLVGLHRIVLLLWSGWGIDRVTVMLSSLPWKWTELLLLFQGLHFVLFLLTVSIADEQCASSGWTAEGLSHTWTCIHSPSMDQLLMTMMALPCILRTSDQSHRCFLVFVFLVCEIRGWMWMIPEGWNSLVSTMI